MKEVFSMASLLNILLGALITTELEEDLSHGVSNSRSSRIGRKQNPAPFRRCHQVVLDNTSSSHALPKLHIFTYSGSTLPA
jgi:hypothetical protein